MLLAVVNVSKILYNKITLISNSTFRNAIKILISVQTLREKAEK